jgi:ABC-2 type transport system ATP-binding protein
MSEVTREVTVHHSARLQVPVDLVDRARAALSGVPGLTVEATAGRPDVLRIAATESPAQRPRNRTGGALHAALRAVLVADVPVLAFEIEGARLRTAFLTMTAGAR